MTDANELITGAEQDIVMKGDGDIVRSEAVTNFFRLIEDIDLSDHVTEKIVESLRAKLEAAGEKRANKAAKALGKAGSLLTVRIVDEAPEEPVTEDIHEGDDIIEVAVAGDIRESIDPLPETAEPEPISEPMHEVESTPEPVSYNEAIALEIIGAIPALNSVETFNALSKYFDSAQAPAPDELPQSAEAVASLRTWLSDRGPLEQADDELTPRELFTLRQLLGWFKNGQDNAFIEGKPAYALVHAKGNGPAKRREIEASVESGLRKLATSLI